MQIQDDSNVDEAKKGRDNVVASANGERGGSVPTQIIRDEKPKC